VYLDAGRAAGLEEGTTVRVERDGAVVAELVVEFVAQASAACKILSATGPLRVGDACSFTPSAAAGAAAGRTPPAGATPRGRASGGPWLRAQALAGSIAFAYRRSGEPDGRFENPSMRADLRWDGPSRRQLALRVRADRPAVNMDVPASGHLASPPELRLYEAELRYRGAGQRFEISGGRFVPTRLEPMGYLDGAAASFLPLAGLRLGVVGGGGSRPASSGFETGGWKLGGYVEASDPRRDGPTRWRVLGGAARVEDRDITRRQFVLVRGDERLGSRVRAWEHVEVDVNPGWKRTLGERHVELTTVAVGGQAALHRRVDVTVGFDSRRDILLPEQRAVPIDDLRLERTRGAQGAVHLRLAGWTTLRVGADVRTLEDGTRTTRAWDASLYASHPSLAAVSGIVHANFYDAVPGRGELLDAGLTFRAARFLRLDLAGGTHVRHDLGSLAQGSDSRSNWVRVGGGMESRWGLWTEGSAEWRSDPEGTELQLEVGRRF
jgi:hypothetical protein